MNKIHKYLKEGVEYDNEDYDQFKTSGGNEFNKLIKSNPQYDNDDFKLYVIANNKANCNAQQINDIGPKEMRRLASTFRWN